MDEAHELREDEPFPAEDADEGNDDELSDDDRAELSGLLHEMESSLQSQLDAIQSFDASSDDVDDLLETLAFAGVQREHFNNLAGKATKVFGLGGAIARLEHYFRLHVGEPLKRSALAGVACIHEWRRRKSEINVEQGLHVVAGPSKEHGLGRDEYVLVSEVVDEERAAHWQRLNRIRRMDAGIEQRALALLTEMYPEPVHRDDLNYIARGATSRDRRVRALPEAGWRVSSRNSDPSLPSGWYRLDDLEQGPPRAKEYLKLREKLLNEADFTCQRCFKKSDKDNPVALHIHHRHYQKDGGGDEEENLIVLCVPCHAGIHAMDPNSVDDELLRPDKDPGTADIE